MTTYTAPVSSIARRIDCFLKYLPLALNANKHNYSSKLGSAVIKVKRSGIEPLTFPEGLSSTMNTQPKPVVSVIIPVFNGEKYIETCLKNICSQNYPSGSFEVIVVNNNSTDSTPAIAQEYPVTIIDCAIPGPSAARNAGAESARGELLLFMDVDCIADKSLISSHASRHSHFRSADPAVAAVGGSITGKITNFWSLCDDFCSWTQSHPNLPAKYIKDYWPTANFSIRKAIFFDIGKFNIELNTAEDVEFCMRLRRKGFKMYFEPSAKIQHQNRDNARDVFKRIWNWARVTEPQIKYGVAPRSPLPILVQAIACTVLFFVTPLYNAVLARRFHVLFFTPMLFVNALIFSFCWAKGQHIIKSGRSA